MKLDGGLGVSLQVLKFVGKASRARQHRLAEEQRQNDGADQRGDKRATVSLRMQLHIVEEQLAQTFDVNDLHSVMTAFSAARELGARCEAGAAIARRAQEQEAGLRATHPIWAKKLDLRVNPMVRLQIRRLWDLLVHECGELDPTGKTNVTVDGYCKLHAAIGKALTEDEGWLVDEALAIAKEDWLDDVARFSEDAGINCWLGRVKTVLQKQSQEAVAKHGWKSMFEEFDSDGGGTLDIAEFTSALRSTGGISPDACSDAELGEMFRSADTDGGGELDGDEFAEWLGSLDAEKASARKTRRKLVSSKQALLSAVTKFREASADKIEELGWSVLFASFDADGSGALDEDEFRHALRTSGGISAAEIGDEELSEVFSLIDEDGGGTLSSAEFVEALRTQESDGYMMTTDAFERSMFELVDYWSHGPTEAEYMQFFRALFQRITIPCDAGLDIDAQFFDTDGKAQFRLRQPNAIDSLVKDGRADTSPSEGTVNATSTAKTSESVSGLLADSAGEPHLRERPRQRLDRLSKPKLNLLGFGSTLKVEEAAAKKANPHLRQFKAAPVIQMGDMLPATAREWKTWRRTTSDDAEVKGGAGSDFKPELKTAREVWPFYVTDNERAHTQLHLDDGFDTPWALQPWQLASHKPPSNEHRPNVAGLSKFGFVMEPSSVCFVRCPLPPPATTAHRITRSTRSARPATLGLPRLSRSCDGSTQVYSTREVGGDPMWQRRNLRSQVGRMYGAQTLKAMSSRDTTRRHRG